MLNVRLFSLTILTEHLWKFLIVTPHVFLCTCNRLLHSDSVTTILHQVPFSRILSYNPFYYFAPQPSNIIAFMHFFSIIQKKDKKEEGRRQKLYDKNRRVIAPFKIGATFGGWDRESNRPSASVENDRIKASRCWTWPNFCFTSAQSKEILLWCTCNSCNTIFNVCR